MPTKKTHPQRRKGDTDMKTAAYRFTGLPSHSAVASLVTTLVSAWFVLAGGAILSDRHSQHTVENARAVDVAQYDIQVERTDSATVVTAYRHSL
jgi:hypothetical protein